MCGIAGVVQLGDRIDRESLLRARDLMTYRGPDGDGLWEGAAGEIRVALAHRRLSIIDLSCAGGQPMVLPEHGPAHPAVAVEGPARFALIYNGELYNYRELRTELQTMGHPFSSDSDTEVLLAAYAQWGPEFLGRLNGMFAFAIWDAARRRLFCARDRLGEKPFHFTFDPRSQVFAFASEVKTLMAMGVASPAFDERALFRYFAYGEQAGVAQTIWSGIRRLPAAHALEVQADRNTLTLRTYRYWDVDPDNVVEDDEECAKETFRALFRSSVALRLRADVPVGTSLSGGLDSTSVLCQIKDLGAEGGQKAFTARMEDSTLDESGIVARLLADVGVPGYTTTPTGTSFLEHADRMFFHQEEPYPSTSMFASYLVHRLAKDHGVTVLLDGQGADEYLAGYAHYPALILSSLARDGRLAQWRRERKALKQRAGVDPVPFRAAARLWMASRARPFRTMCIDPDRDVTHVSPRLREAYGSEGARVIPIGRSALKTRLYADLMLGHLQELLRYTDRNSMAHSREVRLPFLDHRLIEYCLSLPDKFLYRDGVSKWILRSSLRGLVPDRILDRRDKVGFSTPWAQWWSDPAVGPALRERLHDSHRVLQSWLAGSPPEVGSAAALDVLALASMRESLGHYAGSASPLHAAVIPA
jgi:asparagine synthase (glutamine-hydrolysing)